MKKRTAFIVLIALVLVIGAAQAAFADTEDGNIARRFVVDSPHADDLITEGAITPKYFEPNSIMTNGVIDPFFAGGGNMFAPTNRSDKKMKIYVIAMDFSDLPGDIAVPYGLQRNVFTSPRDGSVFDLTYPEIYYNTVFFGSAGLKSLDSSKFVWNGTTADHEFKGLKQLVEEMSMGRFEVEVVCLNEQLAIAQGLDPEKDKWPWFHIDGPMFEYASQGPADCEDYRQFAKVHQAGINAAYDALPGLDIEDIDFIYTITPYNSHGYRSGLQGGSGLDTSFSYNDQALVQRDTEYRHEPGIKTKGGRIVGSGVFGVKGLWGYTGNGFPSSAPNPMSAVRVSLHEFTHGMGMFDDYSYGWMGTNPGETTASGAGGWGVMAAAMGTATPDLFAWRKFRMGWINDDEIETVLPGETKTITIRALGSYADDGGSYTDDPSIKTRMVLIPKEWRTRDTFGMVWNNGWNPGKTDYNWYDWFTNPWVGGETHAIKSFPTFYTLESRKALGADSTMPATGSNAGGSAGVVVGYVANPTWETGLGAGGFKVMTGNNGLRVGGTASWADPHIGLTVTVIESNVFFDKVTVEYTGKATSAAKHVYQGQLTASDNYVTAGQSFTVDFDILTLGAPAPNDASSISSTVTRVATPLGVPGGLAGYNMTVTYDSTALDYAGMISPFDNSNVNVIVTPQEGKLFITASGDKMIDKDTILSLKFNSKTGATSGDYPVSAKLTDVTLLNWRGETLVKGDPGFDDVGTFGDGTIAALYNTTANNNYTPGINSTGGLVRVGTAATYTVNGQIVCDTPGPASGSFIGVESVVNVYNSSGVVLGSSKSDWDGYYSIKGIPAGSGYYVKAEKPKYDVGTSDTFDITTAGVIVPELKLNRTLYTVSGTIYSSDNSDGSDPTPLAGAKVYLVNTGNCYEILGGPAITNADGTYTVQGRAEHKQFVALAVEAEGYGEHVTLRNGAVTNLGVLFGRNPADAAFGTTTQLGVNNLYNFQLNSDKIGMDITLTTTQDVQLRVDPFNVETAYQLRDMDGNAVGGTVNSWGGMTSGSGGRGDDVIRNVASGRYYIEVSRPGYIGVCTPPFTVSSTRVILRNNVNTSTLTLVSATANGTYDVTGTVSDAVSGKPLAAFVQFASTAGLGVPVKASEEDGSFTYRVLSGSHTITVSLPGYKSQTFPVSSGAADLGEIKLERDLANLVLKTDVELVQSGDYFRLYPSFKAAVASNAATLDFTFDKDKFLYRGFIPAEGVKLLQWVETEQGVKLTVMVSGYNTTEYGEVLMSAKEDIDLENEDNEISVTVNYVVKLDDGTKEVFKEVASTIFATYGDEEGDINLILLSDLIDVFGIKKGDADWNKYRVYDYNKNGEIDVFDISTVASKIGK